MSHCGEPLVDPTPVQLPRHPRSQKALILGIVSLAGVVVILPLFLSPYAWYFGTRVRRDIASAPGVWSGRSDAGAGVILGVIGTGLLAVLLLVLVLAAFGLGILTHDRTYY